MANVHVTIDDRALEVPEGSTILEAARQNDIHIPTLCYLKELDPRASCRMCIVEVEGARTFMPSCATKVREGMVVHTNTDAVRAKRKLTLELIMAHHPVDCHHCLRIGNTKEQDLDPWFCEMCFFCDCVRDGICELQALNREYHVDQLPFTIEGDRYEEDCSLGSVTRNPDKCIKCRRCVDVCNDIQTVHNLAYIGRGQQARVASALDRPMAESPCVRCGRCVDVCPTGAVYMQEHIDDMLDDAHAYGTHTVGMVSSSILPDLEKLCHLESGSLDIHRVIAGLVKEGVDCVVSEEQVIGENQALAEDLIEQANGVAIISNSFAVKNFVHEHFADIEDKVSFYPSVQQTFTDLAKRKLASEFGWDADNVKTVVFTAGNENGAEAHELGSADYSMSAREVYRTFKRTGVDLGRIKPTDALKQTRDVARTFGAATAPVAFNFEKAPETMRIAGKKVAIAHNLGQCRALLEGVKEGTNEFDVIRLCA